MLIVAYQIYVSRRVARAPDYSEQQRVFQLLMIWCLPVVGTVICHLMLGETGGATTGDSTDDGDHGGWDDTHGGGEGDGGAGD